MTENFYAPIIIPTLNRHEHLRNCIESLQKNTYAKYTDVYISVDYPPSAEYTEGYEKVCYYLKHELNSGFKNTYIYYQSENLGPTQNVFFLMEESKKTSDECFIISEDDNLFSPVFLEYINYCIHKYKHNTQIMAICGYCPPKEWCAPNGVYLLDTACSWGTAFFRARLNKCMQWINYKNFLEILYDSHKCKELFHYNYKKYWILVESCIANFNDGNNVFVCKETKDIRPIDYTEGLYMTMNNCYALYPSVSLVQNNGFDGSGVNCPKMDTRTSQDILSTVDTFVFDTPQDIKIISFNQELNNDPKERKRATRARYLRFVFIVFGKKAAQKYKNMNDYLSYKIHCIKKQLLSKIHI